MDEQRIIQKQKEIETVNREEETRKSHGSVQKERLSMDTLLSEKEALGQKVTGKYVSDFASAQDASLLRSRHPYERIADKDKKQYGKMQSFEVQFLQRDMKKNAEEKHKDFELTSHQKDFAVEYRQMMRSCRVFDNEVRQTVAETIEKHQTLLGGKSSAEKTELLSKLLTAFLPQREFFFVPPSDEQKKLVKNFLSKFKSNPKKELIRMQQSLLGERLHRDYRDAGTAGKNFRLIYTEMRKREALSAVYPLMIKDQAHKNERETVEGLKKTVGDYKKLIIL